MLRGNDIILVTAKSDVAEISDATKAFVTQREFYKSVDEPCSVIRELHRVTISRSKLHCEHPTSHSSDHLIGNGDQGTSDRDSRYTGVAQAKFAA